MHEEKKQRQIVLLKQKTVNPMFLELQEALAELEKEQKHVDVQILSKLQKPKSS